ncbi:hypothetical protein Tco_0931375, partial [Tanacetum coccineum]
LEDVLATVNSRELQKMTKEKGDGGEELYVRGRFAHKDIEHGKCSTWLKSHGRIGKLNFYICQSDEILKRDCPSADVIMYNDDSVLLGDGGECRVRETSKVQVHMRDGSSFVLDNVRYVLELRRNLISLGILEKEGFTVKMQSGKIKVIKGSLIWLVEETNVTLLAKVRCFLIRSGVSKVFWAYDTTMSTYLVNMSPSSAIEFKTPIDMLGLPGWLASIKQGMLEPVKVKCIFLGYHKVQVLQGVEFEVKPLARGREQHLTRELFRYRENNNETAFIVVVVEKIYANELLTFNDTVACEAISKWKAGLKEDMDARSNVYVLSNDCKESNATTMTITGSTHQAEIWVTKGLLDKVKGNVLGTEIIRDQSGNTLVSQSRVHNGKLVYTFLDGHSILSLEVSLPDDYDVKKNDVGMLDGFDRGSQKNVQVFVDFDYAMGRSINVMGRSITGSMNESICSRENTFGCNCFGMKEERGSVSGWFSWSFNESQFTILLDLHRELRKKSEEHRVASEDALAAHLFTRIIIDSNLFSRALRNKSANSTPKLAPQPTSRQC